MPKPFEFIHSISSKFILPLVLIFGVTTGAFYLVFQHNFSALVYEFSKERAYEIAEQLTLTIEVNTSHRNLARAIASIGSYDDVDKVFLLDNETQTIIISNKSKYNRKPLKALQAKKLQALLLEGLETQTNRFTELDSRSHQKHNTMMIYKINAISADKKSLRPVTLVLFLNEEGLINSINNILIPSLLFLIAGLLLTGACLYIIAKISIFSPISKLISHIGEAKETKEALTFKHDTYDEIGQLVRNYNELMTALNENQQQLIEAKEESEAATKAKSEFLATMTHELRTPLNGIIGISTILKDFNLNKGQSHYVDVINQSGNQLLSVMNDILDFSKIESGKMELSNTRFELHQLVQQTHTLMSVQAKEKSLGFKFEDRLPETAIELYSDDTRIRQVLINLLSNAIKFTHSGSVTLTIEEDSEALPALDPSSPSLAFKISISDTGIGLTQDQIGKLFQHFSQADASTTRQFGGTGLGLAICKNICNKMGAEIDVVSEYQSGTTFTTRWRLPIAQQRAPEHQKNTLETALIPFEEKRDPLLIQTLWESQHQSEKADQYSVLIVDDTLINLHVAEALISATGIRVYTVDNGKDAIHQFQEQHHSLILMDCLMPGIDGYETTQAIRDYEQSHHLESVPIVALTASALQETKELCIAAGMDDFLTKPFNTEVLISTVFWWLMKNHPNTETDDG